MTTSPELPFLRASAGDVPEQPRTTPAEESPAASVALPPAGPSTDCVADAAGGLTFDIAEGGAPPGTGDSGDAALVLRRRGGESATDEVRLPLVHAGDGHLRAVLPSSVPLPEGRWDAYAAVGDGEPVRLRPGLLDLRSLVDRRPDPSHREVAVRIPYATAHGNLTVRSWLRGPHAEAGEIQVGDGAMTVQVRLYGAEPGSGAMAEARCRREQSLVRTVPVAAEGPDLTFTLPYAEPAETWQGGEEAWDLWLVPAAGAEPVRIARLLDDVPDKKHIFSYPALPLSTPHGPAQAGPYYTKNNDLALRIDAAG